MSVTVMRVPVRSRGVQAVIVAPRSSLYILLTASPLSPFIIYTSFFIYFKPNISVKS